MSSFGKRLRDAREAAGITQERLGFEVGVSKASVSAWENDRERPSFDNLPKLSVALDESLDDLILGYAEATMRVRAIHQVMEEPSGYDADSRRASSRDEVALLKRFRALSAKRQKALLEILRPEA